MYYEIRDKRRRQREGLPPLPKKRTRRQHVDEGDHREYRLPRTPRLPRKPPPNTMARRPVQSQYQPLDGGYGWIIVLGGAFTHFLLVGMARCLGVIYLALREKFDSSAQATAWAAAIFNTTRTLIAPLCGMLCNRLGCRKVALMGALTLCVGLVVSAFATSLLYIYFSFGILTGIGGAMVFTPVYIIVAQYFDQKKGKAMAFATLGSGLGNVLLAPLISYLVHYYGYFGAMLLLGALQLNNAVSAMAYVPLHMLSQLKPEFLRAQTKPRFRVEVAEEKPQQQTDSVTNSEQESPTLQHAEEVKIESQENDLNKSIGRLSGENCDDLCNSNSKDKTDNHEKEFQQKEISLGPSSKLDTDRDVETGSEPDNCYDQKLTDNASPPTMSTSGSSMSDVLGNSSCTHHSVATSSLGSGTQNTTCAGKKVSRKGLIFNVTFLVYGLVIMCMQANIQTFLIFLPDYSREQGADAMQAAAMLSIMGGADMAGRFLWGVIFDLRVIRQRRRHFYCLITVVFGVCTMAMAMMRSYVAVATMTVVTGIFEGGAHSQRATVVSEFVPAKQMATAVGFVIFFQGIGNIWGPPIGGVLRDLSGTNAFCYVFSGGVLVVFALLFMLHTSVRAACSTQPPHSHASIH